ncbi:MAG: Bax inhibitor-1/YccA family protein [Bacteroides sp.]|nr:Bax inhibitor-1/YccA family protein [Bacteroidales bacterium]MBD5336722.1 Bax inhibitor-1/YccA family protein [Bacteroides sp.]
MTPPPYQGAWGQTALTDQVRSVMKRVYVRMTIGLLVSAFCALGVASSPALLSFFFGNQLVFWAMFIGMLVMAWVIPSRVNKMSNGTVIGLFVLFSALMGTWLSSIFLVYKMSAIISTFFITAGTFGAMSIYGYCTKSDLSKMGTYLIMGLIGLFIAMIVNWFLHSSALGWVISIVGVLLFVGLTAWDTQQIKRMAAANLDPSLADKLATIGAMNLYLDFINLFLFLLRIFGGSRD